ncbi:FAD dependent oxidoreductase [Fomitopsis serialis]|uniref:FAD dependent oxidoreductase n=1 Tax=Fomitopsis serialis TaxID=139415 RepID=UPI002007C5D2|nr:FAD dependent oxidoreductase [Neoantrodia serialis]KAH9922066.1 FAD dependent oxidoreductase [Neoantrodia serialis]
MAIQPESGIVIVGAGCFGLSTAYHLLRRGYTKITVLDRSPVLPAPEAASTDINKIVRSCYADIFYSKLARDAIAKWKNATEWADCYRESGVLVLLTGEGSYGDLALVNDRALGARTVLLPAGSTNTVPSDPSSPALPPVVQNLLQDKSGYINEDSGWVHSSRAVELLIDKVKSLGGNILPGKAVAHLIKDPHGKTNGVKCADESEYKADCVVLAAGAWTASAFPELDLEETCVATAQVVGKIQLTPEEAQAYRANPVYLDLDSGFYMFPPNDQDVVKCAVHAAGFTYRPTSTSASTPIFLKPPNEKDTSHGHFETAVPKAALQELRAGLANTFPALADKPWAGARMCWYTDSADEDWVIGFHPRDPGVMLATAGSGHALKFLPNIGSLVADAMEGKMDAELVRKFALDRAKNDVPVSRPGKEQSELDLSDIVSSE